MKTYRKIITSLVLTGVLVAPGKIARAGNKDRAGQAGATELLINPWARSSGWAGSNVANAKGLESMFLNVAGTAFTKKSELLFTRTSWLKGTDIFINSFGLTQRVGETGAIGLGIMAMDFGDIQVTTVDLPEGGIGTFSPQYINLGLSYAKGFSDNIYGGMTVKLISEAISDVSAKGVALDAGIQYVTGKYDEIKFGIALKNVGPRMRFAGDGLNFRTPLPRDPSGTDRLNVQHRSEEFELPSLVNIGASYDIYFSKDSSAMRNHRITLAGAFVSNSFTKDEFKVGLEYSFKSFLMVRGGYTFEKGITKDEERTTVFTGPSAGFTVEIPLGPNKSTFAIDYSYRVTNPFDGVHSLGARINL